MRPSAIITALIVCIAVRADAQDDVPMQAMRDELARSMSELRLQQMEKPYFIAYRMDEIDGITLSAALGSLTTAQPARMRVIGVELRVGDYACDNTNYFSTRSFPGDGFGISQAPLDDDYQQIRRQLWLATDAQYKKALEDLSAKRAALQMRKRAEEVPDFTREAPVTKAEARERTRTRNSELEALAREVSAIFKSSPEIHSSSVQIEYHDLYTRYVNSEGTCFTRSSPAFKMEIHAQTQAADALPISDSIEIHGRSGADLPPREAILARVREMAARILRLRSSSSLERYNGPVLFEGVAAAEVFGQQFATGLIAVRKPMSDDPRFDIFFRQLMGQFGAASFVDKIGGRVLPEFLSVTDNPLQQDYRGARLLGGHAVDDDGVIARETRLVDHGTLKALLATRVPVRSAPHSTGSRRGWGPAPSNLLVTSDKSISNAELRKQLLKRAKERGLDHAIVVRHVGGGGATASLMRMASRMAAQPGSTSNAMAEVYRVYADGHEELLQGMELAEMTPAAFKDIVAVGDTPVVFTDEFVGGVTSFFSLGPSAGSNPPLVSYIVPAMLFDDVSLIRSRGPFPSPPVTPSPLVRK